MTDRPRYLWKAARLRARRQGIPFKLTPADITVPTHCPILGIELKVGNGPMSPASATLDRIDPSLGYLPGNVEVISNRANMIQSNASWREVLEVALYMMRRGAQQRGPS